MTKLESQTWEEDCKKYGMKELAKSILHFDQCPEHGLYHITKEALVYHKHIIHERDKKQKE